MPTPKELRQNADDCLRLATETNQAYAKTALTELAAEFRAMAEHSERRIEGTWKQMKGKVKEKWGELTDEDLDIIAGRRDQLEGKIQERYGLSKDQARQDVEDWFEAS